MKKELENNNSKTLKFKEYMNNPACYLYYPEYNFYKRIICGGLVNLSHTKEAEIVNSFCGNLNVTTKNNFIHWGSFYKVK